MTPAYKSMFSDIQKCAYLKPGCQCFPQPIASKATSEIAGRTVETLNGKCKLLPSAFAVGVKRSTPREDEAFSQSSAIIWGEKECFSFGFRKVKRSNPGKLP